MDRPKVRVVADTNVLVRAVMQDDEEQAEAASKVLRECELVAVSIPCLCELIWVLQRVYRLPPVRIMEAIGLLLASSNVVVDRPVVDAAMSVYAKGGDFADGAIAFEGQRLGGAVFVSFDRKAVALLAESGQSAQLL